MKYEIDLISSFMHKFSMIFISLIAYGDMPITKVIDQAKQKTLKVFGDTQQMDSILNQINIDYMGNSKEQVKLYNDG